MSSLEEFVQRLTERRQEPVLKSNAAVTNKMSNSKRKFHYLRCILNGKNVRCYFLGDPLTNNNNNLFSPPNIIRMIKSRRIKWAEHVARMGEMINAYKILVEKP
jgi:hypothetical protein